MRLAYIGIPWRLIVEACRGLPPIQRNAPTGGHMNTIRDQHDAADLTVHDMGDEMPTMKVEVPNFRPTIKPGYVFHARAPQETDIDLITNDEWETVMYAEYDADKPAQYMGQTDIDGVRCNVWFMGETEGFVAQTLTV